MLEFVLKEEVHGFEAVLARHVVARGIARGNARIGRIIVCMSICEWGCIWLFVMDLCSRRLCDVLVRDTGEVGARATARSSIGPLCLKRSIPQSYERGHRDSDLQPRSPRVLYSWRSDLASGNEDFPVT
jgi:hypothetical protein